ncbi:MAG: NUDIX domain-containing protein [Streptosporangiaceae bacterium]
MTVHDGNGWKRCDLGHRHWGRYGAAGLLVAASGQDRPDGSDRPDGAATVLLQLRSRWVSHGGTWAPPGGARDSHETAVAAALREAAEECGIDPGAVEVTGVRTDDHGGWVYQTVLASADRQLPATVASQETKEVAWIAAASVERLRLHPSFAAQWPVLRTGLVPPTIVVDAANVIGSRPDGWWRDRAGAARRFVDQLAALAACGLPGEAGTVLDPALSWWYPRLVVVLEGAAARDADTGRDAGNLASGQRLTVVRAGGSGDDEIVRQAAAVPGPCLVVTADRELRARCEAAGARVGGPRWLLGQL